MDPSGLVEQTDCNILCMCNCAIDQSSEFLILEYLYKPLSGEYSGPKKFLSGKLLTKPTAISSFSLFYSLYQSEMGIYRDNLSAIVIGDNLLPIIVIA